VFLLAFNGISWCNARAMKTIPRLFPLLLAAALVSCANVQERSHIVGARTGTQLTASVGDTVLRVSREKNLPNIAGKADIFGRMTPTGVETVQYLGVKDGRAIFRRRTVDVETGATTMNSTPLIIPNTTTTMHSGSVNVYGPNGYGHGSYSGTSTSVGRPTAIPAHPPAPVVMDEGSLLLSVDLSRKPAQLSVAGKTLIVLQAGNARLLYVLSE
jgi:hypothetical protein